MADFICFFCEEKEAERYIKISKYHYYICESCRSDVTKAAQQSVRRSRRKTGVKWNLIGRMFHKKRRASNANR